jgi:predicted GIY-YIG superfamily endonuclease
MTNFNYFGIEFIKYDLKNNRPYFMWRGDDIQTVYILLKNKKAIYVGQTCDIRSRLMSHRLNKDIDEIFISKINKFINYHNNIVKLQGKSDKEIRDLRKQQWEKTCTHNKKINILERNLIRNLNPKYNILHKKPQ